MQQAGRTGAIVSIQVLRAVAAIAVVISHTAFDLHRMVGAPDTLPHFNIGDAGVDLFFVISGFVMIYATEPLFGRAAGAFTFLAHRIIRIVPLYWLATTFYVALALAIPTFDKSYGIRSIVASYLFIPTPRPEGIMQPVVGQGWTLNYEMFFYVIFAFAVVAPRRIAAVGASAALFAVVVLGHLLAPLPPTLAFWSDPIVLEFTFGILLGTAYREGFRLAPPLCALLIAVGLVLMVIGDPFARMPDLRCIAWGIPAAMIVGGATFSRFRLAGPAWRALAVIGDASYALYLFHPTAIRTLLIVARRIGVDVTQALPVFVAAAMVAAVLLAIGIHYAFERPVTAALRRRFEAWQGGGRHDPRRPAESPSPELAAPLPKVAS